MPTSRTAERRVAGATTPDTAEQTTSEISEYLTQRLGSRKHDMWFGRTRLRIEDERLIVATDSAFVARWIDGHFRGELNEAAETHLGEDAAVEVTVEPELFPAPPPVADGAASGDRNGDRPALETQLGLANGNRPGFRSPPFRRLGEFIVGRSNRLAFSAACQLIEDEQAAMISPLFVHGDCGVGKTHLVQGICRRYAEITGRPHAVRYVTGEQFTNDFIAAIRHDTLDQFRRRMRKLDLLAIDDVHFLSNKVRTQSEFLHTLDAIGLTGARIVIAADCHPRNIKRFTQALVSRFLSGMVVQIDRPDRETREELVRRLADARSMSLSETAIEKIATRCVGSVRELEGAVTKLAAVHSITRDGAPRGDDTVGTVLVDQVFNDRTWQPAAPVRLGQVIEVVCDRLCISRDDLVGSGRHRRVVQGRALVAYLGRELTTHSYPEIAQAIGRTYHSTVHTAAGRLRRQMEANEKISLGGGEPSIQLRDLVDQLRHTIVRG